ncbi:MAG: methyltransferase domain-containing protein [Pseudomonadota bacterium]
MPTCSICGGTNFIPAFRGRLYKGQPPKCASCGSFERHRAVFRAFKIIAGELSGLAALHFAPDPSVDPSWFASYRQSTFGTETSLDMMATGLADGEVDVVISNHVLEHVADDIAALRETMRISGPEGLIHFTVPVPMAWIETEDWGYPKPEANDHYRGYGADTPGRFVRAIPEVSIAAIVSEDPVTKRKEWLYWASPSRRRLIDLCTPLQASGLPLAIV